MPEYEDPNWPSSSTPEGQHIRLAAGLSNPGNPRRAVRMLGVLAGIVVLFVVVAVLLS